MAAAWSMPVELRRRVAVVIDKTLTPHWCHRPARIPGRALPISLLSGSASGREQDKTSSPTTAWTSLTAR